MPWVRFKRDFDWCPNRSTTIAYKAGMTQLVTSACRARAIAVGAVELIERPPAAGKVTKLRNGKSPDGRR